MKEKTYIYIDSLSTFYYAVSGCLGKDPCSPFFYLYFMGRLWPKFKTLPEVSKMLNSRNCWASCYDCKKRWNKTGTKHITMKVVQKKGVTLTRYICDSCYSKVAANG